MQCSNCGAALKATAKICISCGASVSDNKRPDVGESAATTSASRSSENNERLPVDDAAAVPSCQQITTGSIEAVSETGKLLQSSPASTSQNALLDAPKSVAAAANQYIKNLTLPSADLNESTVNALLPPGGRSANLLFAAAEGVVAKFRQAMLIKMYLLAFVAVGCVVAITIVVSMFREKEQINVASQYDPAIASPAKPLDASTPAPKSPSPQAGDPWAEPPVPKPTAVPVVEASGTKPVATPRAKPKSSPSEQSKAPTQPEPATSPTAPASRPTSQEPQTAPVKQLSCADLSLPMMLICKLEGMEVIRKCVPDMKNWNNNIPGCQRGNAGAESTRY
jgi:hypothetical protein